MFYLDCQRLLAAENLAIKCKFIVYVNTKNAKTNFQQQQNFSRIASTLKISVGGTSHFWRY